MRMVQTDLKAPDEPTADDGFESPKDGDKWVRNPNPGRGGAPYGWKDKYGDVWCPTGKAPGRRMVVLIGMWNPQMEA